MAWTEDRARGLLRGMFDAAVASADPHTVLARHLPERPGGRVVVVGAGKSAASMAAALEAAWPDVALTGVVVTRDGHGAATSCIRVMLASHPVPDARSEAAARAILEAVAGLGAGDLVLALMSGGASALMELPAEGLTLADLQAVNLALLESGAPIGAMNAVRKHLSAIKGGRLAAAAGAARVVTLAISDVPGDDPATIGSGPTVPDASSWADVRRIAREYGLALPRMDGAETPKPGELAADVRLIATPMMALHAAAGVARAAGVMPVILGDAIEGLAGEVGADMAVLAGQAGDVPRVLLSGGETTVVLPAGHRGRGGRNTEFLLALALGLEGAEGVWALAGDTDGIDGNQDAAGAVIGPGTLARAGGMGLEAAGLLRAHESYAVFDALGDLVRTGPTLTNVNDFRAILVT